MMKISTDEWWSALREASKHGDGLTSREIADALQCSQSRAGKVIRQGIEAGTIIFAGRRMVQDVVGSTHRIPVYQSVEPGKKGAKGA